MNGKGTFDFIAECERLEKLNTEMLEALKAALYGMDELLRSYAITHVVRGQCKGQAPLNPDELSAADEAGAQYQQARAQVESVIAKAEGSK